MRGVEKSTAAANVTAAAFLLMPNLLSFAPSLTPHSIGLPFPGTRLSPRPPRHMMGIWLPSRPLRSPMVENGTVTKASALIMTPIVRRRPEIFIMPFIARSENERLDYDINRL